MFTSDRFRGIFRGFRRSADDGELDPLESTKRMIDLSDEIAALHKRIKDRSKSGMPEDIADRARLDSLMEELRAKPSTKEQRA